MTPIILYENLLASGTLSASETTADGYDVDNLIDWRPYTLWRSTTTADQYITVDISASDAADTLAIYNHNLGTAGATITVQYWNGSSWVDSGISIEPTDDLIILSTFTSQSATKFRVKLAGLGTTPIIGIIAIGTRVTFDYPPDSPYVPENQGIVSTAEISKAGHLLGVDARYYPIEISPRWSHITRTFVSTYFRPFWDNHAKLLMPFFYAWDLSNRPDDVYYVRIKPESRYTEPLTISSLSDQIGLDLIGVAE